MDFILFPLQPLPQWDGIDDVIGRGVWCAWDKRLSHLQYPFYMLSEVLKLSKFIIGAQLTASGDESKMNLRCIPYSILNIASCCR